MSLGEVNTKKDTLDYTIGISETGNNYLIRLCEDSLPEVIEFQNGIKVGEGLYTNEHVAEALIHAKGLQAFKTPILPRGCVAYVESTFKSFVFFEVPAHQRKVFYHEAEIENIPFPNLVFGYELYSREESFEMGKVFLVALADGIINESSEVFHYPFTNVEDNFEVCMGSTQRPQLNRVSQLSTMPELFFNSQNSDCYYSRANRSGLTFRALMEEIKGKEFPEKYLKTTGYSLSDWITRLVSLI